MRRKNGRQLKGLHSVLRATRAEHERILSHSVRSSGAVPDRRPDQWADRFPSDKLHKKKKNIF